MTSATSFPCPVCRKQTHPVNVSDDQKKWAQQFPTSDLVKDQRKVTTHEPMYCKPCGKKGIQGIPASIWCKTCKVLFCETCKSEYHDLFLEGCETVDVTGKVGMIQRQETKQVRCGKHTKKMDYYCEDHQVLGCSRCIIIDHRRCGQFEVKSYKDLLTEMRKSFTSTRIKHIIDPDLLTVDEGIPLSMGEIRVEKNPVRLPGLLAPPLSECEVSEVNKFCIKCPSDDMDCYSPGVVYLPDDHIVVGDCNNKKLKLFTVQGKCEDEMKVQGKPYDMCRVDAHTVAVANYDGPVTYVIRVESTKLILTSEIKLSNNIFPWGITPKGDGFMVSSWTTLYNVQLNGNTQQIQTFPANCWHLVFDPRSSYMYISQWTSTKGAVAVYRVSDGTCTDLATVGTLKGAMGVDVDVEGNVYVCGRESNNVVQMSEDGRHVRELLTSSDGVDSPRAISVCGNKFVVTNQSFGNRNYVQVFELC